MKARFVEKGYRYTLHAALILLAACCCIGLATDSRAAVEDYAGSYSGTYSGDDHGVFHIIFYDDGTCTGISWSTDTSEAAEIYGSVDANGDFDLDDSFGGSITGNVDNDGHLTGTWTGGGMSGDLEGDVQDPDQLEAFEGNYAGTSAGDSGGTWEMTVSATGILGGYIDSDAYDTVEPIGGIVNADGVIIALGDDETMCYGAVTATGAVAGEWHNYNAGESGTFSGSLVIDNNSSPRTVVASGDSGGGGCFIQSLH